MKFLVVVSPPSIHKYENPVYVDHPRKDDLYLIRLTIGVESLPHPSESGSTSATLPEEKIFFNSIISTPGSQFIYADIKDYFICSPMERFEYIKITFLWIPKEIRIQYNLYSLVDSDWNIYCEVRKFMYVSLLIILLDS